MMKYSFVDPTICLLSEPSRKLPYILIDERAWSLLSDVTVCASRVGWVLFAKMVYELCNVTFYYVYNPLTKEIISLPRFKWHRAQRHKYLPEKQATFSSVPTSPDCVFIVAHICDREEIFISTYSNGDTKWKTRDVTPPHPCFSLITVWSTWRELFIVIVKRERCHPSMLLPKSVTLLTECNSKNCWDWSYVGGMLYFLAYGGHLCLVELRELEFNVDMPECNIYRFDWFDRVWKKMESLEGGAIFLGKFSFGISAGEQTKMVANRVYYFSWQSYSHRFLIYGSEEKKPAGKGEKSESQDTIYYATLAVMDVSQWIWMEPPLLMPSGGQ
ncbi:hypothetical protein PVL29_018139 [Vitis rotundifolia]|uniref:KIB1-4 beta-propeller domain-containing protein n=1 Tax=Vitis rotundifolia TaxID=103349 RepID=A0AA39DFK4_VITRO|nr:hypothetical protein PVL29_018139 [Vitis rotundifolia]